MAELFYPNKEHNQETEQYYLELSVGIAVTMVMEMEDSQKAMYLYLSHADSELSQVVKHRKKSLLL